MVGRWTCAPSIAPWPWRCGNRLVPERIRAWGQRRRGCGVFLVVAITSRLYWRYPVNKTPYLIAAALLAVTAGAAMAQDNAAPAAQGKPRVSLDAKDRKSTRLNSSHVKSSYAVFCLKKKKKTE